MACQFLPGQLRISSLGPDPRHTSSRSSDCMTLRSTEDKMIDGEREQTFKHPFNDQLERLVSSLHFEL